MTATTATDNDDDTEELGEDSENEEDEEEIVVGGTEQSKATARVVEEQGADEHNRESQKASVDQADKVKGEGEAEGEAKGEAEGEGREEDGEDEREDAGENGLQQVDVENEKEQDEEEGREDDERAEEERGGDGKVQENTGAMEQHGIEVCGEEGRIPEENHESLKEGRKRLFESSEAYGCSTPKNRANKRRKSDGGESEGGAATNHSSKRAASLGTIPRSRTASPTGTAATSGSARVIVRQNSVLPGLQDTETAVWDAAKRDSIISSLSLEQQEKMTDCLAYLSARYRRLDLLESQETLLAINKRVNLAAMAQYRESLVPKVVGGNRARDANLKLFGAIIPHHSAIERPEDKAANAAASQDWLTLRDRLGAGMTWLQRRDLFSGNGAFLALPPQSVPDSYVSRITAKNFGPLLDLLDVAWRALDGGARRTMDALVRCALTGQPLAEAALALERSEGRISADQAGLLPILAARRAVEPADLKRGV
ncbi:hypothetical protein KC353_g14795 [Hortaea werneckii]|nr:hypothetical protein KC353_g14795 [Hortaea werneckii]